jgi:eukaryotic-like serine/threonine-protein kinase
MSEPGATSKPFKNDAPLGSYTIIGRLGSGGMGEVYRARDTKLERDVAIKVLLPEVVANAERLARFQREARVLAALNHPRIAAIYGLDDSGGSPALVMELVEGPTLADRLAGGPLAVDDCIRVARQIAEGLEYAHEQGIVHRDLKPANVKVSSDDSVKLLDFGLAKAVERDGGPSPANSPTATWMATQAGVLLGTAAYMAPEQAKGKAVDRRADNWAFGCVLYEMLTGAQAFHGETVADILGSVMRGEPDWSRLPSSTPPALRDLVRRCLRKDVHQRLQAIGDARIALGEIAAGPSDNDKPAPTDRAPSRVGWMTPLLAGTAIGAILVGLAAWNLRSAPVPSRQVTRFTIALPAGQVLSSSGSALTLSDDGRQLAYVAATRSTGVQQIYLRPIDSAEATPLAGTEGAVAPFFSPDGQWLGFFANGRLKKIAVTGGAPQTLADVTSWLGAAWISDHTIAFVPVGSGIQQIPDDGGEAVRLTTMLPGEVQQSWPAPLPSGGVLFGTSNAKEHFIAVEARGTGNRKDFKGQLGSRPRYLASGHLIYAQDGNLMAVPFDLRTQEVSRAKPAIPVVKGIWQGRDRNTQFSVSADGSLAYVKGQTEAWLNRLVWVSRTGVVSPVNGPAHFYYQPRIAPDGRHAVTDVLENGLIQVWMTDLDRGTSSPFTFEGSNRHGVWTHDSTRVIFQSDRDGTQRLYWQAANGAGQPEPLMKESQAASEGVFNIPYSVDASGILSYVHLVPTRNAQFLALQLPVGTPQGATPPVQQFLESGAADGAPQLSPDGRWVAYASDESGRGREIFVRAFRGPGGPWRVSTEGGNEPQWNPNGRELFYRSGQKMMAVDLDTAAGFTSGKPHVLFEGDFDAAFNGFVRANYDVSPDGQRFLMLQPTTPADVPPSEISVVLNWSEELKRLVPVSF